MKKITILIALVLMCAFANAQIADEIIQKHIEKTGGKKAWDAIKSIKKIVTVIFDQGSMNFEHINTRDGYLYAAMDRQGTKFVQMAFDGKMAWGTNPQTGQPQKRNEEIFENMKRKAKEFPSPYIDYKAKGFKIKLLGTETIDSTECYKIEITKGQKLVNGEEVDNTSVSFISKENYLEIASEDEMGEGESKTKVRSVFSDFREINGLILSFHKKTFTEQGMTFSTKVESYEINAEIDYSIFSNLSLINK